MIEIERQMYRFLNAKPDPFGTEKRDAKVWAAPAGVAPPHSYAERLGDAYIYIGDANFDHLCVGPTGIRALLGRGPAVAASLFGRREETPRLLLEVRLPACPAMETLFHCREFILVIDARMDTNGLRLVVLRAVTAGADLVFPDDLAVTIDLAVSFEAKSDRLGNYFAVYGQPDPTSTDAHRGDPQS